MKRKKAGEMSPDLMVIHPVILFSDRFGKQLRLFLGFGAG
jgi:hypothetical protein